MPTKRMTASEREALLKMNVAMEILLLDIHDLDKRAELVPYAKRDLAMLSAVAKRLLGDFAATIPPEQVPTYLRAMDMVSYVVGVKRPGGGSFRDLDEYGMWLPYKVIQALLGGCHDHCLMCSDDLAKRRACKLRKALEIAGTDIEEREDGDCPYYTLL